MNTTQICAAATAAATHVTHVTTAAEVRELADRLNNPAGMAPSLVVTTDQRTSQVHLDMAELCRRVDDDVHVYVLETGSLTWEFSDSMPPETSVWGGAARIYPAHDLTWTQNCYAGDLLFANIRPDNATAMARIIAERVNTLAENARNIEALTSLAAQAEVPAEMIAPQPFRGTFSGATSVSVGRITSPDAPRLGMLQVDLDVLLPGMPVSIGSVFTVDDVVSGRFDASGTVIEVDGLRTVEQMAADLVPHHVYPAVVTEIVCKSQVKVHVVPGVVSTLTQSGIDASATVGDVVPVQVQSVGERDGKVRIVVGPAPENVMNDSGMNCGVNDAPALRTGGPVWASMPASPDDADDAAADAGMAVDEDATVSIPEGSVAELKGLRTRVPQLRERVRQQDSEIGQLRADLATSSQEITFAWDENDRLKDENDQLRARLTAAGLPLPDGVTSGDARTAARTKKTVTRTVYTERPLIGTEFDTLDDQLRAEVQVNWMHQVDAADKHDHKLNFDFGTEFLASVDKTVNDQEAARQKLPLVMAWIACGMPERTSRHHAYRENEGGGSPQLVRTDGAKAFRVDLESKTAAARRLHYWRLPDGSVEFARVGFHDEPGF